MIKKFFIKLTGAWNQRENTPAMRLEADQKDQAKLTRERHEQIMESRGDRKYVPERAIPSDEEILGPSDSKKA